MYRAVRGGVQDVAVKVLNHTENDPRQIAAFEKVRYPLWLARMRCAICHCLAWGSCLSAGYTAFLPALVSAFMCEAHEAHAS